MVAVVTGSTKGIGKAIGVKLLEEGYYVVFNYAKDDLGRRLLDDELKDYEGLYCVIKNDFCDEEQVSNFVEEIRNRFEKIDVLVANAGITDRTSWEELSMEQWNRVLHINLTVPAFLTQKLGKIMIDDGSILYIGSILGEYAHSLSVPYGVSKSGLHFLTESLVKEYANRRITVNAICTGFTDTEWQKKKSEEQRMRIQSKIALQRFAEPEEIADLAYMMITNRYMTGSIVKIDGGYVSK